MNNNKIKLLFQLLITVQSSQKHSPAELARELEINIRTLFRYIKELQNAGIPVCYSRKEKRYTIGSNFFQQMLNLTDQEALCLLMLAGNMKVNAKTSLGKLAVGAITKIEKMLPIETRMNCHEIIEKISKCPAHQVITINSYDDYVSPIKVVSKKITKTKISN